MRTAESPPGNEQRPGLGNRSAAGRLAATETTIHRPTHTLADLDRLAAHVDGTFVVVVKVAGTETKYRRRCYLTAKSAEAAARRATERGENATVYLAELTPLWRVVA